ncbi:MAG: GTP-binding protein [Planctomycetota bacterium]
MLNQKTSVCVLSARGMAAISSIAVAGADARGMLEKVFRVGTSTVKQSLAVAPNEFSGKQKTCRLEAGGTIMHGVIVDGERVVDEVVVGCDGSEEFVIHCHGNPLLVERIVKLLQSHGAMLTDAESFAFTKYQAARETMIEAEAKLAMQKSATLLGAKILQEQIDGGLSTWVRNSVDNPSEIESGAIKDQCIEILEHSEIAKRIIEGVRIVIAGPPNSGKSTLLNCLAGQEQVIVSDAAGTTRDWVSVTCQLGPIRAEFIDTAGLDDALAGKDTIEQTAQHITKELLKSCALVLYLQDVTTVNSDQLPVINNRLGPIIYINNKCDLVQGVQGIRTSGYQEVFVSAKQNEGIDLLAEEIMKVLGITDFDITMPIAFTKRQRQLLSAIVATPENSNEFLCTLINNAPHGQA